MENLKKYLAFYANDCKDSISGLLSFKIGQKHDDNN
jgi:hypothetical protein